MKYADALSRCPMAGAKQTTEEIKVVRLLPVRNQTMELIREGARRSESYQQLLETIRQGWPETKRKLKPSAAGFYPYRSRLKIEDDLVLHGDAIVVPRELRGEFVKRSCHSHMSADKNYQRAKSCIFWPHMRKDIELHGQNCPGCQSFPNAPKREPMVPHEIPSRPWQKVGFDIATLRNTK